AAEIIGDAVEVDEERPAFFVQHGSAMVSIIVHPVAIHSAVVELLSWLVTEVPLTPKLERFLLQTNYSTAARRPRARRGRRRGASPRAARRHDRPRRARPCARRLHAPRRPARRRGQRALRRPTCRRTLRLTCIS